MATGHNMRGYARRMKHDPSPLEILAAEFLDTLRVPFKVQQIIGRDYILDFVGLDRLFVLEVDGVQHSEPRQQVRDRKRDDLLRRAGFTVVRLTRSQITLNTTRDAIAVLPEVPRQKVRDCLFLATELLKYPKLAMEVA